MFKEFKKFIMRGNVLDMAVGIAIGSAFTKISTSLVNDIIMPPIGLILGKVDFSSLAITLKAKTSESAGVYISYGELINTIINFLIIAFVIFIVVKQANKFLANKEKKEISKTCQFCQSSIAIKAIRCPECTSKLDG